METKPKFDRKEEQSISIYEPLGGERIDETVKNMIALAKDTKGGVKAYFSGAELLVDEGSNADKVIEDFKHRMDEARREYEDSPEGQESARKEQIAIKEMQLKVDVLVEQLSGLDFENQEALLDWIGEFQSSSDRVGVKIDSKQIVKIFADHGYRPNMNMGEEYNDKDRDNFIQYIVGRALGGIEKDGHISQIIPGFIGKWKEKFTT